MKGIVVKGGRVGIAGCNDSNHDVVRTVGDGGAQWHDECGEVDVVRGAAASRANSSCLRLVLATLLRVSVSPPPKSNTVLLPDCVACESAAPNVMWNAVRSILSGVPAPAVKSVKVSALPPGLKTKVSSPPPPVKVSRN